MTVPRLAEVWRYPVKGIAGIRTEDDVSIGAYGLQHDHCRMVVSQDEGRFCSQRTLPRMALIRPFLDEENDLLSLVLPGVGVVVVPLRYAEGPAMRVSVHDDHDILAIDQGPEAAEALSAFLGAKVRFVRIHPDSDRRTPTGDRIAFHDAWPILAASTGGVEVVNGWLAADGWQGPPIDIRRFRPQLVFSGCDPFAEDHWRSLWVDGAQLFGQEHCRRCEVPDVDPDTAERTKGVFKVLSRHRGKMDPSGKKRRAYFGRNMTTGKAGYLRAGKAAYHIIEDEGIAFEPAA